MRKHGFPGHFCSQCNLSLNFHICIYAHTKYDTRLTSIFKIHSKEWWLATWSQQVAPQVLVHICTWVGIHVYMGMFMECRVDTYTSIAMTYCTTPMASLSTLFQPLATAVAPRYWCRKLTHAIANNVVISSTPWGASVCKCGVNDKAVFGVQINNVEYISRELECNGECSEVTGLWWWAAMGTWRRKFKWG